MASRITNFKGGHLKAVILAKTQSQIKMLGEKVVERAQALVPKRTMNLHDSIHYEVLKTRVRIIADAKSHSGHNRSYAYFVETGTGKGPAQPYLRPALISVTPDLEEAFKNWN